ncbi:DinB family protein [Larkinella punicea]|uniref:DinB family protein n=1 Tax=Larkinella punicea TaxID=2315727 RepID=A0A368JEG2_9BACT|nr:DinB family protein [Larkinella punicea]RCR66070.1 DinB family protein [Larkinella punicea]
MSNPKPEVWQRGPVAGIPSLLQPVAHALLQAREEVYALMNDFPSRYLWQKPAGVASVGFHLQHLTGVLDRLFTYARNESLSPAQRAWLAAEGKSFESENPVLELISRFNSQVDQALQQLANTDEQTLTDFRGIGRAQLPSTVLGLLFHSAEHTQRHVGQLFVTVRVLLTYPKPDH